MIEPLDPDPEMHTTRELLAKVEDLVAEHLHLRAENKRLRAVAETARVVLGAIDATVPGRLFAGIEGREAVTRLRVALDRQPDVSPPELPDAEEAT